MKNCPFYGRSMYLAGMYVHAPGGDFLPSFLLLDTRGNQCGLIVHRHSPCKMEIEGNEVHWPDCPYIRAARMEEV